MTEAHETKRERSSALSPLVVGRLAIVAAAVLWSSSGLFAKSHLFDEWPTAGRGLLLAFWRAAFAAAALLPWVRGVRLRPAMLPMVLAFAGMNATYLSAMVLTTAANAIWLQCTAPFWVLLLGWGLGLDRPTRADIATLGFVLAGVGLILFCELSRSLSAGVVFGVVAGVFYAIVVLCLRGLRAESAAWLVALNNLTTVVVLAPYVARSRVWPHGAQWAALAAFGGFQIGLPYLLFTWGLKRVSSHEAAALVLVEPVLVPLWVYLAWRSEVPAWWTMAGGTLILLGLLLRQRVGSATAET